ncbi:MAG: thioredoxin [Rickettsiales bacterium]|jgi:thioredoxin 1|nr:thioredoxin [Rickettsiales bacterium]
MKELNDAEFADFINTADKPVLVDFWAPWCAPCRGLLPIIEDLSTEIADKIIIAKMNVDSNPATAKTFSIRSIPMLMIFKSGQLVEQRSGAGTKNVLTEWINTTLAK